MSSLEDEVRAALRAEGDRLRPVRPLRLPPPDTRPGLPPRLAGLGSRVPRLGGWLVPALAAAVVVLVAIGLVTVRAVRSAPAGSPPPAPASSSGATPRYYVSLTGSTDVDNATTLVVGDALTGSRLATIPAPEGTVFAGTTPAAAGDNRTFIVAEASQEPKTHPPFATTSPLGWYLLKITPGARPPVQMTRLPIQATAADGIVVGGTGQAGDMALSADGTKLAVLVNTVASGAAGNQALRVYSVSSGRLLHAWSVQAGTGRLATDLSWAGGDTTVAFAATWEESHTEMRTLSVTEGGTDLLADSHVVWSQYVPVPPHNMYTAGTPRLCADPFLTADGQAVVCTNSTYSPRGDRGTIVWLAYPISSPASPRQLGSVQLPPGDPGGFASVEWANASGSQVIGMWESTTVGPMKNGTSTDTVNIDVGVVGGGTVQRLNTSGPQFTGYVAW